MIFLTSFFKSPVQTPKEKVVAREKCYTKMGLMRSEANFHIDIQIKQKSRKFSKIRQLARVARFTMTTKKIYFFF